MATITLQDIGLHRELIGKIWCEMKGDMESDFHHMNLKKMCDSPEEYDFNVWECPCPKPTLSDMLTITKAQLVEIIERYSNTNNPV